MSWRATRKKYLTRGDTISVKHEEISDLDDNLVTDFTGWLFHATLKKNLSDTDTDAVAKINTSDFTLDGPNSKATGHLDLTSATVTVGVPYYLDSQVIDQSGRVATLLREVVIFEEDVSERTTDV